MRSSSIPPQPSLKGHTIRLVVATAIGFVVMFGLLMLAVKYAQRDWNLKNIRVRTFHSAGSVATSDSPEAGGERQGWDYQLHPSATQRQMARMASDPLIPNGWLILARGLSAKAEPQIVISALRMAVAIHGEDAEMKNDLGVVYLQQKRIKDARAQFFAAEQIRPGFAPTRFNLALCAISDRDPELAVRLLGQYLGRRPDDISALRLQSTLLSQLGRPQDALRMLERFLKDQPADQPLFLEAAMLAARLGQNGNAIRYLDTALNGNSILTVVRAYQSPPFRGIRLSGDGDKLAARMADKARAAFGTPVPEEEIQPLRATPPAAKIR
jgi:Flp pilus assembly protein TadD